MDYRPHRCSATEEQADRGPAFERCPELVGEQIHLGVLARGMDADDVEEAVLGVNRQTPSADPAEVEGTLAKSDLDVTSEPSPCQARASWSLRALPGGASQ
jgi:hypothetical protein